MSGQRVWLFPAGEELTRLGELLTAAAPFSFLKLTPGHLEILGSQTGSAPAPKIVVAGEALPAAVADRWRRILGDGNLVNEYGPTEASVGTCIYPVDREPTTAVVPIGHPLPNMAMYVLDENLHPVPVGVAGELYVGEVEDMGKAIQDGTPSRSRIFTP